MRISLRLGSCLLLMLASVNCGGSKSGPSGGGAPASRVVGTSGGAVASTDGNLQVAVPAGAVTGDVTITVAPAETPAAGAVSTVYEIGPTGTQFAMPVTLTLHYTSTSLDGTPESALRVATFAAGAWQLLPGAVVDTQAKTVSGLTTHLSPYAIVAEMNGKTCATIQATQTCTGSASQGGGGSTTCTAPTCAGASNVCAGYPGATMDSCGDGTTGYSATCCFPSGGPICFAVSGGSTCTGSAGGGAPNCPAQPTCAGATTACAAYPGATLQNCTDSATGYAGACCFEPQAPVCISTGSRRACAGSTGGGGTTCPPAPSCADGNPCAAYPGATAKGCTDDTDGYQVTCCFPLGTLPATGGGSGRTTTGGADAGTGTGGVDAGAGPPDGGSTNGSCIPGAACQPGYACGGQSGAGCMQCTCSKDGILGCGSCDQPDAGGPQLDGGIPPDCTPGAACQPGYACGGHSGAGCMQCACSKDGILGCGTCDPLDAGGTQPDAGGPKSDGGSAPDCTPGVACQSGYACGGGGSGGACMDCTCGQDGTLACAPCDKPDAGGVPQSDAGAPPPPDGGGAGDGKTCQVSSMPSTDGSGAPCRVMEVCPDGTNYTVRCDATTSSCTCTRMGTPTGEMPSVSCGAAFDPTAALTACGFPAGTL